MSIYEYDEEKHMRQEREECLKEGREEGQYMAKVTLVCKKLAKGKILEQIADELEADVEEVAPIYEICKKHAPEYDVEAIYEEFYKHNLR